MLSDRPYMRDAYERERTSFLTWLVSAVLAGFAVQLVFTSVLQMSGFVQIGALSANAVRHGELWTLVSYPLLHRNPLHVVALLLGLYFIGRELAPIIGDRRMWWLAFAATLAGGLAWFGVHFADLDQTINLMGASVVLWCYVAVFACLFPNREVSFLIFFVLPVTVRPKYVAWALVAIDFAGLVVGEIMPDRPAGYHVGHSAHLAAMLVGWIYYRYFHEANWLALTEQAAARGPVRGKKITVPAMPVAVEAHAAPRQDIRAELDRILDKINSHGLASLTADEKRLLDNGKSHLNRD